MRHVLIAVAAALAGAVPAQAQVWEQVYPLQRMQTFAIEGEGVTVKVTPPPPYPDGAEVSDEEFAATYADARITVLFPGLPSYEVPKDEYRSSPYGISVGIGRMAPDDAAPTVLIGGFSGGMHCCATLQAISLVDGAPVSTLLPMKDCEPLGAFPTDIDGAPNPYFDDVQNARFRLDRPELAVRLHVLRRQLAGAARLQLSPRRVGRCLARAALRSEVPRIRRRGSRRMPRG